MSFGRHRPEPSTWRETTQETLTAKQSVSLSTCRSTQRLFEDLPVLLAEVDTRSSTRQWTPVGISLVRGGRKPVWVRHSSTEWLPADVALGHLASVQVGQRVATALHDVHSVIFPALRRTRHRRQ
jgi:hypothetical protein